MADFCFDGYGAITITVNDSSVTVAQADHGELLALILDGCCPICLSEIPQDSKLCCSCLSDIFQYHRNHHACIR